LNQKTIVIMLIIDKIVIKIIFFTTNKLVFNYDTI